MKIISTNTVHMDGVKILMYGASGSGKTTMIKTAPNPFIISSESGLLALSDQDIPAVEVSNEKDLEEVYQYVLKSEYDTVCLDSISDIAETILTVLKTKHSDGRAAYGALADIVSKYIRLFRDIKGKNVYFSAKEGRTDIGGSLIYGPAMPGQTLTTNLPYFFDEVLRLECDKKDNRVVHTRSSFTQICKDRSGKLDKTVEANISTIINTITKR